MKSGKVRILFMMGESLGEQSASAVLSKILIEGDNCIVWRSSGTKGDLGTASVAVNLAETIVKSEPGLKTIIDFIPFRGKMSDR